MNKARILIWVSINVTIIIAIISYWIFFAKKEIKDLPEIIKSGRLTVLTEKSNIGFVLQKDTLYGFQYEIIKAFANSLGLELEISPQNDLKKSIQNLKNGDVQIIANLTPITTELINEVSFSTPIMSSKLVLVQQIIPNELNSTSRLINSQLELADDTIHLATNSFIKQRLRHLSSEIADTINLVEIKNSKFDEIVQLVADGKIKYTIVPQQFAIKMKVQHDNLDISIPLSFTQEYAWIVNKESVQLLQKLNQFIEEFKGTSEYWVLYRKYYH